MILKRGLFTNAYGNKNFSSKKRSIKLQKIIFNEYFNHKQTLQQTALHHKRSIPWVKNQNLEYEPEENTFEPRVKGQEIQTV